MKAENPRKIKRYALSTFFPLHVLYPQDYLWGISLAKLSELAINETAV
jgi:hypothetical protein